MRQIRYLSGIKSQTPQGHTSNRLFSWPLHCPIPPAGPSATLRERPQRVEPDVDPYLSGL